MFCRYGFTAHGEIRLLVPTSAGNSTSRASLINPGGHALHADGLNVEFGIICQNGFHAQGEISLVHARIGGVLDLRGAQPGQPRRRGPDLGPRTSRPCAAATTTARRRVNLTNTKDALSPMTRRAGPRRCNCGGFVYDTLENDQVSVQDRLHWLTRNPGGYTPQPYNQLAVAYRRPARRKPPARSGSRNNGTAAPCSTPPETPQLAAVPDRRLRLPHLARWSMAGRLPRARHLGIQPRLPGAHDRDRHPPTGLSPLRLHRWM